MKYQVLRGMRDIFEDKIKKFSFVEEISKKIFISYGYEEMRTPILEKKELFTRSLGDKTDIVSKEMYAFEDRGSRQVALRPEGTAPVIRAVIEKSLLYSSKSFEKRFFYIGPMFRYDRPQEGRYRQFYQIGAELIGVKNAWVDMEIIEIAVRILEKIGIKDFKVHINNIGCLKCREDYKPVLLKYLKENKNDLCVLCKERMNKNILRIFDCKNKTCKSIMKNAPKISTCLCNDCLEDFNNLKNYLTSVNIEYIEDDCLVRGLDYYTGSVFEIKTNMLGTQDAIAAGGRYDGLIRELGGDENPAVGFAFGTDRIVDIMTKADISVPENKKIFFIFIEDTDNSKKIKNLDLINKLRNQGYTVQYESKSLARSIKAQLRTANNLGCSYIVFVEQDETYNVKDMNQGKQEPVKDILNYFRSNE